MSSPRTVVLIPAHNEAGSIVAAVRSVQGQTSPPTDIVVVADNCTDATAELAAGLGAEVFRTRGNRHKKAGALNQALSLWLSILDNRDRVMVMDADSHLDPYFLETAHRWLDKGGYGGIGGTFRGRPAGRPRFVETLQCNEYARYARDVRRKRGEVLVLTGTATVFPVAALRDVVRARRLGWLPNADGQAHVYDTEVLTEDNELTFALRHLGWKVRSPDGCTLTTEVMPTWKDLYRQRLRWKRGAMENLMQYGFTRFTAKHWGYQFVGLLGLAVVLLYLGSIGWSLAVDHRLSVHPVWIAVTGVFAVERCVTLRSRGWRQMLLGALVFVEFGYDLFLQATHLKALADTARRASRVW